MYTKQLKEENGIVTSVNYGHGRVYFNPCPEEGTVSKLKIRVVGDNGHGMNMFFGITKELFEQYKG